MSAAPYQQLADDVDANISGAAQANADVQHFRSAYADTAFLRDRMLDLFAPSVQSAYRDGYLRALQKHIERGSR